jgi:hypothetical protein
MLKNFGVASAMNGRIAGGGKPFVEVEGGLDIVGEPDEADVRSLAAVNALRESDFYVKPTNQSTELAQKLREENTDSVREFRWEQQELFAASGPDRIGRILSEREFFDLLGQICKFKANDWSARGMRGLSILKDGKWEYVGAVQCGYMPEFSLLLLDEHGVPTVEKYRGWRGTVLLRLILGGYVTEHEAHRVFGKPDPNRASRVYRRKLWEFRHRKES